MSDRYDEVDHYIRDIERDADEYAEWLEARELERADTLAERGEEHKPISGSTTGAERPTSLVKSELQRSRR